MLRSAPIAIAIALSAVSCGKPPVSPTPPPGLDAAADQQASAAAPDGKKVGAGFKGVARKEDDTVDFRMPLDPASCYVFATVGEGSVQKISLYLYDASDDKVADESGEGRTQFVHCPETPGMYRIHAKVGEGRGHFAVSVYARPAPPKAAPPPPPPAPVAVDLAAMIEAEAKSTAPGATRVGELFAGSAEKSDWFTALKPGQCYWFIGVGEPGEVKELYLYLWDSSNTRMTDSKSVSNKAVLGHCAKTAGMYKFQAKVNSGSGAYKVGVYVKPAG
jgi:hypothetical protein